MHMKKLSGKKIAKNMMLSVLAQAVSVLVGFVLNLIVPKFIPESDYSLWQSYLLYSQYLGVLHFGLMDGIVLRYARFDYDELDKDMVRSQYRLIMELDLLLSAGLLAIGCLLFRGDNRVLCILLACTVCIEITFNYISFTFQITNRITHYVAYIAVYRVIYCLLVLGCLAAQAGVRYSIDHPDAYIESNLVGFFRILEACRHSLDGGGPGVEHLVYASSSSVYGSNTKLPYSTEDKTDSPVSLYAATKKADELLACAYAGLYRIPATGLRFFTVYGPAGRPDMAYFKFTDCLRRGERIPLYNYGSCMRDFTYVDDIVEGILRVMTCAPAAASAPEGASAPHRVYNIGNSQPVKLLDFVRTLQQELIREELLPQDHDLAAHTELLPMQPGDVLATYADTSPLERDFGFRPATPLREGLRRFARWYRAFYGSQS